MIMLGHVYNEQQAEEYISSTEETQPLSLMLKSSVLTTSVTT